MVMECCTGHNNIFLDLKNIINSQSGEIIKLKNKLISLEIINNKKFFNKCVLQEMKYNYELKKRDNKYRNLLKQKLLTKINLNKINDDENQNSYVII